MKDDVDRIASSTVKPWLESRAVSWLMIACIITMPVQTVLRLPKLGMKVQIPEFIFLASLFVVAGIVVRKALKGEWDLKSVQVGIPEYFGISFISALALSAIANGMVFKHVVEITGVGYLVCLCFVLRNSICMGSQRTAVNIFIASATLAAILGIAGFMIATAGYENCLSWPVKEFMYFGKLGRAQGLASNPNMLASILTAGIILVGATCYDDKRLGKWNLAVLAILCVSFVLTFSKSGLTLIIGIVVFGCLGWKGKGRLLITTVSVLVVISCIGAFMFVSHVYVHKGSDEDLRVLVDDAFITDRPIREMPKANWYKTSYLINKEAAWKAFSENPIFGVGPGSYNEYVGEQKRKNAYPMNFPNYDPHSTYLGTMAEAGIPGILVLLSFLPVWLVWLWRCYRKAERKGIFIALIACSLGYMVEAVVTDMINFRHLWVLAAIGFCGIPKHDEK